MKPLLLVAVIAACFVAVTSAASKPNQNPKKKLETRRYMVKNNPRCTEENWIKNEKLIARAIVFGEHGRKLPETLAQVKPFCKETRQIQEKVDSFVKECFAKEVKDWSNIIMYMIRANLRQYCSKKGSGAKVIRDLIRFAPCTNKYMQRNDTCFQIFINRTAPLINLDDDRLKIPHTCCNYVHLMGCVEDFIQSVSCVRSAKEQVMDLIRRGISGLIDIACGDFNEQTDACERLGPPPKPRRPNNRRYLTFAMVMLELLESIKDYVAPGSTGAGSG